MKYYYIDAVSLQALINSGTYSSARASAQANGIEFRTTWTVIEEMLNRPPHFRSAAENTFLQNPQANIGVELDPFDLSRSWNGKNMPPDAGEEGLAELARRHLASGGDAVVVTQDAKAIKNGRLSGGAFEGVPVKSIGTLPGFGIGDGGGQQAAVPDALPSLYEGNPLAEVHARDSLRDFQRSNQRNISEKTTFRSDVEIGVEAYTRARYGNPLERVYGVPGQPPAGEGWVSESDARAMRPDLDQARQNIEDAAREKIRGIRDNPASYGPDGDFSPAAAAAIDAVGKAVYAAGVGLAIWDAYETSLAARELARAGDVQGAAREVAALGGRLTGGMLGAELGWTVGSIGGLPGKVVGAVLGGAAGVIVGDAAMRQLNDWLASLFDSDPIGAASDFLGDLAKSFGDMVRALLSDPLVLDLDGDGIELVSLLSSNVRFDIDSDGLLERVGWVSPQDGLLVHDENGNGLVDDVSELFGSANVDGYDELAQLDTNQDGKISALDSEFVNLRIWRDVNQDGISTVDEMMTLAQAGVVSFSLGYTQLDTENGGNITARKGSYTRSDNSTRDMASIWLGKDESVNRPVIPSNGDMDGFDSLPNLPAAASMPDLWTAMYFDPVLKAMVEDLLNGDFEFDNFADFSGLAQTGAFASMIGASSGGSSFVIGSDPAATEVVSGRLLAILYRWAGVDTSIPEDPAHTWHQQVFEAVTGISVAAATSDQRVRIERVWPQLVGQLGMSFLIQAANLPNHGLMMELIDQIKALDPEALDYFDAVATLTDGALMAVQTGGGLSEFLAPFAMLSLDTRTGEIKGDFDAFVLAFTATEAQVEPNGRPIGVGVSSTYGAWLAWFQNHGKFLYSVASLMGIGSDYVERVTGWRWMFGTVGEVEGTAGDDVLEQASSLAANKVAVMSTGSISIEASGAPTRDQALYGYAGNDELRGHDGVDRLVGGTGNDLLKGGADSDMYVYSVGDGLDRIIDEHGTDDVVYFSSALRPEDLIVTRMTGTNDLLLYFGDPDHGIILSNQWAGSGTAIEQFHFVGADGFDAGDIASKYLETLSTSGNDVIAGSWAGERIKGLDGNDSIYGGGGADSIDGGAGNDVLVGDDGNDLLTGGLGNDVMYGGIGADTYYYNEGDGDDTIEDYAHWDLESTSFDTLKFGAGLAEGDLIISNYANDWNSIRIDFVGRSGSIKLVGQNLSDTGIESVVFADGSHWTLADLMARYVEDQVRLSPNLIHGSNLSDSIVAGIGNNTIKSGGGNDSITGGVGNDFLLGDYGSDTYNYSIGDGDDIIEDNAYWDYESSVIDTINFGEGIAADDLVFSHIANDWDKIRISFSGYSGSITINGQNVSSMGIEAINFFDGDRLDLAQIMARYVAAQQSSSNDLIHGSNFADTVLAGAGDDTVIVGGGNDLINGGTGNDALHGGTGADVYSYALGDGDDVINDDAYWDAESSIKDRLDLGSGITAGDIQFSNVVNDVESIRIRFAGQSGSITINKQFNGGFGIEQIGFADGTVWELPQIIARYLADQQTAGNDLVYGTDASDTLQSDGGNDAVYAFGGNDDLTGGAGDDRLVGGVGDDIYRYAVGDGSDVIADGSSSTADKLVFGAGINPADVLVEPDPSSSANMVIRFVGRIENILVEQQWAGSNGIDNVIFANGTVWNQAEIANQYALGVSRAAGETLNGTSGADVLNGYGGNDTIYAGAGNDTLIGGTGNDYLRGDSGNDTYVFEFGDGQDVIFENESQFTNGGTETLRFGLGISINDLILLKPLSDWNDLKISISETSDSILIDQQDANYQGRYYNRIENFVFQTQEPGGSIVETVVGWQALEAHRIARAKTTGGDIIVGSTAADTIDGGAGADTLYGWTGNDILIGGTGNDYLRGDAGSDTYVFNLGDGQDTIFEAESQFEMGGTEMLRFGLGITLEDLVLSKPADWNDLQIGIVGTTDSILIDQQDVSYQGRYYNRIENFVFQTQEPSGSIVETVVGWQALEAHRIARAKTSGGDVIVGSTAADTIDGGAGADTLYGWTGNDTLIGGTGNDYLRGDAGNDTYVFNLGDGQDTIFEAESQFESGGTETLRFGLGITLENLVLSKLSDWYDLQIGIAGTSDSILIDQQDANYQGRYYNRIENFVFQTQEPGGSIVETVVGWQALEAHRIARAKTTGGDIIVGSTAADTIDGGAGADTLYGWTGNDILIGGEGNDILNGGEGTDTVLLSGLRTDYSMVASGGALNVSDNAPTVDGNDGTDSLTAVEKLKFSNGEEVGITSPIILDLDGGGVATLSASASWARYDMDGDGLGDDTSWMGSGEGMLFLDRDGNGTLTNAGEFSFVGDIEGAASDLAGLRAFDSNGDGILSSADDRFADFRIWRDGNGDGVVDHGEILSLVGAGVQSLGLTGTAVEGAVALGDVVTINTGSFTRTDGTSAGFIDAALTYFSGTSQNSSSIRQQLRPMFRRQLDTLQQDGLRGGGYRELRVDRELMFDPISHWPKFADPRLWSGFEVAAIDEFDQPTGAQSSAPPPPSHIDRQLTMIVQEMSVFDVQPAGEGLATWQRDTGRPLELFA